MLQRIEGLINYFIITEMIFLPRKKERTNDKVGTDQKTFSEKSAKPK